jgi:DNA-binding transcriptional ArsR family regulator
MQTDFAVEALRVLADPTRLDLYRLLVRRGPLGISADDIAATLGLAPSALATSMTLLERAELATSWRNSETAFHAVNPEGVRRLLAFLTADCCDGHPDLCRDLHHTADFNVAVRLVTAR